MLSPFQPIGSTASISASTTTASAALTARAVGMTQVRIYNQGAATVFVAFGTSGITATTSDIPIPSGTIEVYSIPTPCTHVAAITSSGTATVYATPGQGT